VRKDPNYLTSKKIRVYSSFGGGEVDPTTVNWAGDEARRYTFRQDYGPWNALGLVRLDMPNKFIVYMHDTPMKDLFAQDERAFSAGCIRVQEIFPLASWILSGESGWSIERLQQAASSGQKQTIRIGRPVPVYFVYLTAWVSEGVLNYRNDLYNRDRAAPMAAPTDRVAAAPFQILAP
jgi:murein L,D-transpeptidase YcbB/YkuD